MGDICLGLSATTYPLPVPRALLIRLGLDLGLIGAPLVPLGDEDTLEEPLFVMGTLGLFAPENENILDKFKGATFTFPGDFGVLGDGKLEV